MLTWKPGTFLNRKSWFTYRKQQMYENTVRLGSNHKATKLIRILDHYTYKAGNLKISLSVKTRSKLCSSHWTIPVAQFPCFYPERPFQNTHSALRDSLSSIAVHKTQERSQQILEITQALRTSNVMCVLTWWPQHCPGWSGLQGSLKQSFDFSLRVLRM